MAMGAYPIKTFGPIYSRTTSPMRRRIVAICIVWILVLLVFYVDRVPQPFGSYTQSMPASFTKLSPPRVEQPTIAVEFPKKIWQTGSDSKKKKWEEKTETWISQNPD